MSAQRSNILIRLSSNLKPTHWTCVPSPNQEMKHWRLNEEALMVMIESLEHFSPMSRVHTHANPHQKLCLSRPRPPGLVKTSVLMERPCGAEHTHRERGREGGPPQRTLEVNWRDQRLSGSSTHGSENVLERNIGRGREKNSYPDRLFEEPEHTAQPTAG